MTTIQTTRDVTNRQVSAGANPDVRRGAAAPRRLDHTRDVTNSLFTALPELLLQRIPHINTWYYNLPAGTWDYTRPLPQQLAARIWAWTTRTRLRRWLIAPLLVEQVLFVIQLVLAPDARATTYNPFLDAIGMTDSYGVPVSQYMFSSNNGTIFDFGSKFAASTLLEAEASFFIFIAGLAIWFIIWVLSFGFITTLVQPVANALESAVSQTIPGIAAIAAVIASGIIAYHFMKGDHSRALAQLGAALVLGALCASIFAKPVSWVLADDGPLMQGRNIGLSIATNTSPDTTTADQGLEKLRGQLVTGFIRRPLQAWNFGAVVDATPSCADAWSSGTKSGDSDNVKDGVRDCGASNSATMKDSADNPSAMQLGTGGGLILFAIIFAFWSMLLACFLIIEFFRALFNAARMLYAGAVAVIPGGPQVYLLEIFVAVWFSGLIIGGFVVFVRLLADIMGNVLSESGILGVPMIIILMLASGVGLFMISRGGKKAGKSVTTALATAAGNSSSSVAAVGRPDNSPGVMRRAVGAASMATGAYMGGVLATEAPTVAKALEAIAPHQSSRIISAAGSGAKKKLRENERAAKATAKKEENAAARTAQAERQARVDDVMASAKPYFDGFNRLLYPETQTQNPNVDVTQPQGRPVTPTAPTASLPAPPTGSGSSTPRSAPPTPPTPGAPGGPQRPQAPKGGGTGGSGAGAPPPPTPGPTAMGGASAPASSSTPAAGPQPTASIPAPRTSPAQKKPTQPSDDDIVDAEVVDPPTPSAPPAPPAATQAAKHARQAAPPPSPFQPPQRRSPVTDSTPTPPTAAPPTPFSPPKKGR